MRYLECGKWALVVTAAVAGIFLLLEHRVHVAAFVPLLILLACPLMHIFMKHGHGAGGHEKAPEVENKDPHRHA